MVSGPREVEVKVSGGQSPWPQGQGNATLQLSQNLMEVPLPASTFRNKLLTGPGPLPRLRPAQAGPAHLLLRDLHVEDDVIHQLRQGFPHSALELAVFQQRVDKLENAEDQVLEAQDLACRSAETTVTRGQGQRGEATAPPAG